MQKDDIHRLELCLRLRGGIITQGYYECVRFHDFPDAHRSMGKLRFDAYDTWLYYRNKDVGGGNGTRLGLCAKSHKAPVIWKIDAINSNEEAQCRPPASFDGL